MDNKGMIAIETLIAFVGFLVCIFFIVAWVNVASLQLRVHRALTQSAIELSFYAHALEMVGLVDEMRAINRRVGDRRTEMHGAADNAFGAWNTLTGASQSNSLADLSNAADTFANQAGNVADTVNNWGDDLMSDPVDFMQGFLSLGLQTGLQAGIDGVVGHLIAPSFFWRYMGGRTGDGDYRVGNAGAVDFSFVEWGASVTDGMGAHGVSFLASHSGGTGGFESGNADIVILSGYYLLDFGDVVNRLAPFPIPEFRVTQRVKTRAWVGNGNAFQPPSTPPPAERRVQ